MYASKCERGRGTNKTIAGMSLWLACLLFVLVKRVLELSAYAARADILPVALPPARPEQAPSRVRRNTS
jgi:hypothetical protein